MKIKPKIKEALYTTKRIDSYAYEKIWLETFWKRITFENFTERDDKDILHSTEWCQMVECSALHQSQIALS